MKINLLEDIKEIVKNDREHNIRIEIDHLSIKVLLEYDPSNEYLEDMVIPIEYVLDEEFAFIPNDDYKKMFRPNDYGLTLDEIILIKDIMQYLESHKQEIAELVEGYSWNDREGGNYDTE